MFQKLVWGVSGLWDYQRVFGPAIATHSRCVSLPRSWSQRGRVSHLEGDGGSLQHSGPDPEAGC